MSPHPAYPERPSRIWISFLSITFGASLALLGGGIVALPLDLMVRGCLMAGLVVMVGSSFMFAGTVLRPARSQRTADPTPSANRRLHHR
jgi:hypothetical protein